MPFPSFLRVAFAALFASSLLSHSTSGAIIWNEGVNGDFSNARLSPTSLSVSDGSNIIIGTTGGGDLEYFTFTIAGTKSFTAMLLDSYASTDNVAFIAIQSGTTFTQPNTGTNVGALLGYTHFGPGGSVVGSNLLTSMGTGGGSIGFTPPLPGGSYVFWAQQLGATTNYQFNIQVIPEPKVLALGMGLAALGGVMAWRRWIRGRA